MEKVIINNKDNDKIKINDIIKKICDTNTIKEVEFPLYIFYTIDTLSTQQRNDSVEKIKLYRKEDLIKEKIFDYDLLFPQLISLTYIFPNLVEFFLESYYLEATFKENKFMEFLEKLIKMNNIKKINIYLKVLSATDTDIYTEDDLIKKFPGININKFEKIFIKKEICHCEKLPIEVYEIKTVYE